MVILDPQTRVNFILGFLQIIIILVNDQLLLQGRIKERELTKEDTSNHGHHRQVILVVTQTQTHVTVTTMMTKKETMAGAEEADVWNATLEDHRFLERHLPVRAAY